MDDLDSVLSPYWKTAQKATLKALTASLGFGLVLAGALWGLSNLEFSCVLFGGIAALGMWLLVGSPDTCDAIAPDELLQQVAAVIFVSSAAQDLRETLSCLGYLTMGDIAKAFQNERTARYSQESLGRPGAKALLGS